MKKVFENIQKRAKLFPLYKMVNVENKILSCTS